MEIILSIRMLLIIINAGREQMGKEKSLENSEAEVLVDRIYSAKESLVKFGREVFRLSSEFGEVSRLYPDGFKHLDGQQKLFAN